MHIITVAGARSGTGKTTLSTLLIAMLPGFAAIKVSVGGMYTSVTDDQDVVLEEGKDTRAFHDAGARPVVLVRCPAEELAEALGQAMVLAGGARGVVVEGNSASGLVDPDVSFFVAGPDAADMKATAADALKRADVVVVNIEEPSPSAGQVDAIRKLNRLAAVTTMGAVRAGSPELAELVRKLS